VFDTYGTERLTEWKKIRDRVETDIDPFYLVLSIWCKAPFVNQYLDHTDPKSWPDPWRLLLDSKFDNLAIVLGMLYTFQLTERFSQEDYKIYMIQRDPKNPEFCLLISDKHVLNLHYGEISGFESLKSRRTSMIYQRNCRQ
jgi:hypothetical protein